MAGKILDQGDLQKIYKAQEKGDWKYVQGKQADLKESLVDKYKKNWDEFHASNPDIKPVFNLTNKASQVIKINREMALNYNLEGHLAEFDKKSDASTAGIRAFYDILHSENPSMMYNDLFLSLLIDAEAQFLPDVHKEIKNKIENIKKTYGPIEKFVADLEKKMSASDIRIVEEIYQMPLLDLIGYLETNMVKLVGGEVRAHTAKFVELESRILAARGVTVLAAPDYGNSIPIYMHSFLSFVLGATGATNYTPSHSPNYLFGRKVLAIGGGQLLPDKYEIYRQTLREIIKKKIMMGDGYQVRISEADDSHILRTLTYERMTGLYSSILNTTEADVKTINAATAKGHRIVMNGLNGSTWKTLLPILKHLKIDKEVFELIYIEEDPFFDIGFIVTKDKNSQGEEYYGIDHLGTDVSMTKVAKTIPYDKLLATTPIGTLLYECDADSDRFCAKQVVEANEENYQMAKEYGVDHYELDEKRMLIALSPNKMFLLLDIADYERMKEHGVWDDYYSMYIVTYVSTRAWPEFADAVPNMKKVITRVGYKNLTEMQQEIEKWYFHQPEEKTFKFTDQVGNEVFLDRDKKIRVHCKSEESGGRVAGMDRDCFNLLGEKTLAMPEKSDPDSLLSELTTSSKIFLKDSTDSEYRLLNRLAKAYGKYKLKSKIDARFDLMHGDQGAIALMPYKKQQEALKYAAFLKSNFNNFFFSLGKAVKENKTDINRVIEILVKTIPALRETWLCLKSITLCEEPLSGGRSRPEGVPMVFADKNGHHPMVTEIDFRPSGTDPLKSKIYIDAEQINTEDKDFLEREFMKLTEYNLFEVLSESGVESIEPEPDFSNSLRHLNI